jgi:hypothetical protein
MVPRRRVAFHTRAGPGRQVSITVLTRDAFTTFEEFHPVDLRATSILAGFSANRNRLRKIGLARLGLECIYHRSRFISHLQQLRPRTMIVFPRQFARRVKPHM